jgi:hypothetical protein
MPQAEKKNVQSRNIVGQKVRKARLQFKPPLTQDQLSGRLAAEGTNLDRVAIAKIEGGTRSAFDFEVRALALVLKIDVRWLLGLEAGSKK